jgi:hypothetical protein
MGDNICYYLISVFLFDGTVAFRISAIFDIIGIFVATGLPQIGQWLVLAAGIEPAVVQNM